MGEIINLFDLPQDRNRALSVLLVDDQEVFRSVARGVLERGGYCKVIAEAADGESAVEMFSRVSPDVIVMDIQMAGTGGLDATRRILREFPQANIVLTSMGSDSEYPILAREIGARGFLPKKNLNPQTIRSLVDLGSGPSPDTIAA